MNWENPRRDFGVLLALSCLTVQGALCEELDLDSGDRYLLLATKRTSTMQKELDQAAAHGYRIVSGSPLKGSEIGIVLELQAEPAEGFRYLLLATNRLSTMEKELNEVGRQGFRVTPQAIFPEGCDCGELIVVTEREGNSQAAYEYRVLGTHRTSTLNREINQAAAEGFVLAAITRESENVAIMMRELEPEQSAADAKSPLRSRLDMHMHASIVSRHENDGRDSGRAKGTIAPTGG